MDLHQKAKNGIMDPQEIGTILTDEIKKDIRRDRLHIFAKSAGDSLFRPGEVLYLIEHAAVCINGGDADESEILHGILYLSSDRLVFTRGELRIDLPYTDMIWITQYDVTPQILEIRSSDSTWLIRVPDTEAVHKCIQLIRDHEYLKVIEEPFSYAELLEKADYAALIFAFEHTLSGNLPDDIEEETREVTESLRGLRDALDKHPDRRDDAGRFISCHISSAIRAVSDCNACQNAEADEAGRKRLYDRTLAAERALNEALKKKTAEINREDIMAAIARAEALQLINGQRFDAGIPAPEEMKQAEQPADETEISDMDQIIGYAEELQRDISNLSAFVLDMAKTHDLWKISDALGELLTALGAEPPSQKRGRSKPFGKTQRDAGETGRCMEEADVARAESDLQEYQMLLAQDISMYRQMYDLNLEYHKELTAYIAAGRKALNAARAGNLQDPKRCHDQEAMWQRIEKKLYEFELSGTVSAQMSQQIRMLQKNCLEMFDRIHTALTDTIPLWRTGMQSKRLMYRG